MLERSPATTLFAPGPAARVVIATVISSGQYDLMALLDDLMALLTLARHETEALG
jgi:hypothetical protein